MKLLVPKAQVLDANARNALRSAAEGDPYVLRIRELQPAKPWMELLASGARLVIDIEECVNKTSGRGSITLGITAKTAAPLSRWSLGGYSSDLLAMPRWCRGCSLGPM